MGSNVLNQWYLFLDTIDYGDKITIGTLQKSFPCAYEEKYISNLESYS